MATPSAVAVPEKPNVVQLKEWTESVTKAKFDAARERYATIRMMIIVAAVLPIVAYTHT
jgi:hypothetical protein